MKVSLKTYSLFMFSVLCSFSVYSASGINGWSSSEGQVRDAKCKNEKLSISEMWSFVTSKNNGENETKRIHGLVLSNEDKNLLQLFKLLTTKRDYSGRDLPLADQANLSELTNCENVRCALEDIFGKKLGVQYAYVLSKYGLNSSYLANKKAQNFTEQEYSSALAALRAVPEFLLPLGNNKRFVRYISLNSRSKNLANATMEFYDYWSEHSSLQREYAVFHEIGHNLKGARKKLDYRQEWLDMSGWKKVNGQLQMTRAANVSYYAKIYPTEDFAETVSAYRYNPELLKRVSMKKYEYIKNAVFYGVEFGDESLCKRPTVYSSIRNELKNIDLSINDSILDSMGSTCQVEQFRAYFTNENKTKYENCLKGQYINKVAEQISPKKMGLSIFIKESENLLSHVDVSSHLFTRHTKDEKQSLSNEIKKAFKNADLLKYYNKRRFKKGSQTCNSLFNQAGYKFRDIYNRYGTYENASYINKSLINFCEENKKLLIKSKKRFIIGYLNSREIEFLK